MSKRPEAYNGAVIVLFSIFDVDSGGLSGPAAVGPRRRRGFFCQKIEYEASDFGTESFNPFLLTCLCGDPPLLPSVVVLNRDLSLPFLQNGVPMS